MKDYLSGNKLKGWFLNYLPDVEFGSLRLMALKELCVCEALISPMGDIQPSVAIPIVTQS